MPSFHSATTNQVNALRSGGWAGELRFAVNPNAVVWQATVNQTISANSFIQFAWDNTLEGAYTDVVVGMTFLITATDDPVELRSPLLSGRVSQSPSGTIFYCNESGINLTDGMIVTVIASFEILQKDRIGDLVDGWQAFEDQSPLVKNMQAFYYVEDAVSGQVSFAPIGQPMAEGATIAAYHWTIAGATYDVGDDDTQNITVTVPYGHTWAYLDVIDSNDTTLRFIFEILVCGRDDPAFMFTAHDDVQINGSIEAGWNVTTTFFAGVETLLNRTRCAIVAFDVPKAGAADLFNNVAFVGYIVQESTDVTGDVVSSTLSQTQFELQSFAAIAGQLPVPSLPVRNTATPDEWGDMNLPTPQRTITYLLTRYSTLANLCAIDVLYSDSTWFGGEMDLEAGTLLDSVNRIGAEIQARLVFFPQGDATYEIDADFLPDDERDALPTLLSSGSLTAQDVFNYSLPVPYYKTVGQVQAGCATFYTDGSIPVKLDALAPATARQEGNERPVILAQLLEADLSQADAEAAAKRRVGDLLEYLNPPTNLPATYKDGWRVLGVSTRVWVTYDLPGTDSTRGLPIESSTRWLLQSVSMTWVVASGSWEVQGVARRETRGGLAQTKATISPNVIDTSLPVLPGLSDYDAFVPDSSLNYGSTDPLDADLQPYTPFDLSQYEPMTTEDAAAAADNDPGPNCALVNPPVNFSAITSRFTPRPTINGEIYTVTVKGRAQIGGGLTLTDNPGVWEDQLLAYEGRDGVTYVFRCGVVFTGSQYSFLANGNQSFYVTEYEVLTGTVTGWQGAWGLTPTPPDDIATGVLAFYGTDGTATVRIKLTPATPDTSGDAFYEGTEDGAWELYTGGRGLLLNGLPIGVPPEFNDNSEYQFQYVGDGNQTSFTYYDTDYTGNQNLILYIRVCGPNMGS